LNISHVRWPSLIVATAVALSACERRNEPSSDAAPAPVEPVLVLSNSPLPGPTCYLNSVDDARGWVEVGGREAQCFTQDSCSGGMGERVGLCFKWAVGPEAPALPWSATLTNPRPTSDIPPPESVYESTGEVSADCLDGGCEPSPTRVSVDTPIHARPDMTAPIIGTIQALECVQPRSERILSTPQRGIVLETTEGFTAGDVIYLLRYDGDYLIWWRGEEHSGVYSPTNVVVRWDETETDDPREGRWIEYTRTNGDSGWARNPQTNQQGCTFVRR
jgi:hypothetical protein